MPVAIIAGFSGYQSNVSFYKKRSICYIEYTKIHFLAKMKEIRWIFLILERLQDSSPCLCQRQT